MKVVVAHDGEGQAVRQGKAFVTVFAVAGHFEFGHGTVAVAVPRIRHSSWMQEVVRGLHVVGVVEAVTVGHETYLRSSTGVEVARRLEQPFQRGRWTWVSRYSGSRTLVPEEQHRCHSRERSWKIHIDRVKVFCVESYS